MANVRGRTNRDTEIQEATPEKPIVFKLEDGTQVRITHDGFIFGLRNGVDVEVSKYYPPKNPVLEERYVIADGRNGIKICRFRAVALRFPNIKTIVGISWI